MFDLTPPPWVNSFKRQEARSEFPGIFLYMNDAVLWTTCDSLLDVIRICTPSKALKQHIAEVVESFKKDINENAIEEQPQIRASLTWIRTIPGQLSLRVSESTRRPKKVHAIVFEITPEGNFERIVRTFELTDSPFTTKKR